MDRSTDVLMITYNRPGYTRLALETLLENSDESTRVWLWHNGADEETLTVANEYQRHVYRFHHCRDNLALTTPTNWLYENAAGAYLSKVDDDCLVPALWVKKLREAHEDEPRFGVIGCWRFQEEDFEAALAQRKIRMFSGGHRLLVNMWIEGSGYLMKRACVERFGPLRRGRSFTDYCIEIGRAGWINGWIYPFLYQEHLDDPRAEHSALKTDADLNRHLPLSARRNGVASLEQWLNQLRRSARVVQEAPTDPAYWSPGRRRLRHAMSKARRILTGTKAHW